MEHLFSSPYFHVYMNCMCEIVFISQSSIFCSSLYLELLRSGHVTSSLFFKKKPFLTKFFCQINPTICVK